MNDGWSVLVVWPSGEMEYFMLLNAIAVFPDRESAQVQRDFMVEAIDGYQSINVVRAPKEAQP